MAYFLKPESGWYPTDAQSLRSIDGVCGAWRVTAGFAGREVWKPRFVVEFGKVLRSEQRFVLRLVVLSDIARDVQARAIHLDGILDRIENLRLQRGTAAAPQEQLSLADVEQRGRAPVRPTGAERYLLER